MRKLREAVNHNARENARVVKAMAAKIAGLEARLEDVVAKSAKDKIMKGIFGGAF